MSWQALVDAALLGTGRSDLPTLPAELEPLDDGTLLTRAALWSRARRAGAVAVADDAVALPPALEDPRPHVHPSAASRLALLLTTGPRELVHEWLQLLSVSSRRLPPLVLPSLLSAGHGDPVLRSLALPLLGPLGPWLAAQNDAWTWASGAGAQTATTVVDEDTWATATGRVPLLESIRSTDPARGRELLLSTWEQEPPGERSQLLPALSIGLSLDDEQFLVTALRDKRAEVRTSAVALLLRLPASAFGRRAEQRAAGVLRVEKKLLRKTIVVEPPTELTADMKADGYDGKPPQGTGLQAHLLRQVVAAVPVRNWTERTGLGLGDVVGGLPREWSPAFVSGLREAAARDADLEALNLLLASGSPEDLRAVLSVVPPALRERLLLKQRSLVGIDLVPGPWSPQLTQLVAQQAAVTKDWQGSSLRQLLGSRGDPTTPVDIDPSVPGGSQALSVLADRAAMRRELSLDPEAPL